MGATQANSQPYAITDTVNQGLAMNHEHKTTIDGYAPPFVAKKNAQATLMYHDWRRARKIRRGSSFLIRFST